ncbi:glutamine amidotransferase domain protein, partial [Mycobacterium ulcerans str. Harvey]
MGHPRAPTDRNAHPHRDAAGKIAVVHNGIIENFAVLRQELEAAGVEFASDTDTEVAVHLVAQAFHHGETAGDFPASVLSVLRRLEGHFTLVFANADDPGTIVAARRSTPLVLGIGDGEMFVGSDVAAFITHTRHAVDLGQDQAVVITADGYRISDFDGNDDLLAGTDYRSFTSIGTSRPPKRAATSTSCSKRSPSSRPRSPRLCSATSWATASSSTNSGYRTRSCGRSTRSSWSPAAPPITRVCSPSTRSSIG